MEDIAGDLNFAFYEALDEALLLAKENIDMARHAPSDVAMGLYLKMASRAMRCALEIYSDRFGGRSAQGEERNE